MPSTPRALGRAKALTAGTMLVAAVATGGVAVHLADAETTTASTTVPPITASRLFHRPAVCTAAVFVEAVIIEPPRCR